MNNKIQEILGDLYMLDDSLREHEKDIIKIIEGYMKVKPDTKFDKKFMLKLRKEIMEKAVEAGGDFQIEKRYFWTSLPFYYRYAYVAAGAVIILSFAFVLSYALVGDQGSKLALAPEISLGKGVLRLQDNAFGTIHSSEIRTLQEEGVSAPLGLGGGGFNTGTKSVADIGMPTPMIMNYDYIYKGEEFSVDQGEMTVYKRIKGTDSGESLGNYISRLKFDIVDLSKFNKTVITNLNLAEDKEFGYSFYFNFTEDILDIGQNYNQWPHPERDCLTPECFDSYRLSLEDVPEDNKIISIADKFLRDYNIDISHYGEPFVQDSWRVYYERAEGKYDPGIPEEVSVIYPLVIEGNIVRDEGGNPSGMSVSVNIRYNKVSGARPITPYSFEGSSYAVETDTEKILRFAKQGGIYPEYRDSNPYKTIEIELGTPIKGLVRHWSYDYTDNMGQELFVPALIFPVQNVSGFEDDDIYYYREYITVPIVKEIMEKYGNGQTGGSKIEPFLIKEEASQESISVDNQEVNRDDDVIPRGND